MTVTIFTPGLRAELARLANTPRFPTVRPRITHLTDSRVCDECGHPIEAHELRETLGVGDGPPERLWWCDVDECQCDGDSRELRRREAEPK